MKIAEWAQRAAHGEASDRDNDTYVFRFRALVVLNTLGAALAGYCALTADIRAPAHVAAAETIICLVFLANLFYLLVSRRLNTSAVIGLTAMAAGIIQAAGEMEVFVLLWLYAVPLFSFLLLGLRAAIIFNMALPSAAAAVFVLYVADVASIRHLGLYALVYVAVMILAGVSEIRYRRRVQTLERISVTDALTGVFNRRKFQELIELEVQRAQRYGTGPAIVMFDIDHYKLINDCFGHQTGDEVLRGVAHLVQANVRRTDSLVRLGGDEFLILAPQINTQLALKMAEKLRVVVKRGRFRHLRVTISIGVAQWRPGEDAGSLLARADRALYRAKRDGRDRVAYDRPQTFEGVRLLVAPRDPGAVVFPSWPPPPARYHTRPLR